MATLIMVVMKTEMGIFNNNNNNNNKIKVNEELMLLHDQNYGWTFSS
jgi:hypothetical protein